MMQNFAPLGSMNNLTTNILDHVSRVCTHYVSSSDLPRPFVGERLRAIFLGADPGTVNTHSPDNQLKFMYPFQLEHGNQSPYFRQFLSNLNSVNLSLDNLYVQNLCQNYFKCETHAHRLHWLQAAKYWTKSLALELDSVDPKRGMPVLISAYIVLEALCPNGCHKPEYYYLNKRFIRKNQNLLNRTLIPFFRGGRGKYAMSKWQNYSTKVSKYVAQNFT